MFDSPLNIAVGDLLELSNASGVWHVAEKHPTGWAEDVFKLVQFGSEFYLSLTWSPANGVKWRRANSTYSPVEPETPVDRGVWCARKHCPEPYQEYAEANMPDGSFVCFSCRADGFGTTWAVERFAKEKS